jgi:hypothetical protein
VFFESPAYRQNVSKGSTVRLRIRAADPDGSIKKIVINVNGHHQSTLTQQPFTTTITASAGDAVIEAIAFDNKGKSATATTRIRSDIKAKFVSPGLPYALQGAFYKKQLFALGNGTMRFLVNKSSLPKGLSLSLKGVLNGIPETAGTFGIGVTTLDEDEDSTSMIYQLVVKEKRPEMILVTDVRNDSGVVFPVSKLRIGAVTHFDRDDDEVTVSNTSGYNGITYIPGNNRDTNRTENNYLSFNVDEDARVYVAYEKKDHLFTSTIPEWLKSWKRDPSAQIVAQYFYYDIYYKDFPKGKISLPGTDEKSNQVGNNYFVMIRKALTPYVFAPEINLTILNPAALLTPYQEQLTALHGRGSLLWQVVKGKLPPGLQMSENGRIEGIPGATGTYSFGVQVKDENGSTAAKEFTIVVE